MRLGSRVRSGGRSFRATLRPRRSSVASHTSPMPPDPTRAMTSYGPSRVPAWRGMCWRIIRVAAGAGPAEFQQCLAEGYAHDREGAAYGPSHLAGVTQRNARPGDVHGRLRPGVAVHAPTPVAVPKS